MLKNLKDVILEKLKVDDIIFGVKFPIDGTFEEMIEFLHRSLEELILRPVPMESDTDTHIVEQHSVGALLARYMRCSHYAYFDVHISIDD